MMLQRSVTEGLSIAIEITGPLIKNRISELQPVKCCLEWTHHDLDPSKGRRQ